MIRLLFTREMSPSDVEFASKWGIECAVVPMIGTSLRGWDRVLSEHPDFWEELGAAKAVVFTSRNGVAGVVQPDFEGHDKLMTILRKKPVYTVGESTADAIEPFGILARFPDDYNAKTLSRMMLLDGVHTRIMHFCGSIRRHELGEAMQEAGISVKEVIVYDKLTSDWDGTTLKPFHVDVTAPPIKQLEELHPHGVVFYSPSAVHSFFDQGLDAGFKGAWFAIGQTTADALRQRGIEPMVPRAPMTELLMEFASGYFKKQSHTLR